MGVADLIQLSDIPEAERTPWVAALVDMCAKRQEQIHLLQEQVQTLKDEIARLKGNNPRPDIKPSKLEKGRDNGKKKRKGKKRKPGPQRKKTAQLQIHETLDVSAEDVPEGSRFKGYQYFTVQDIKFCSHNTVYRLERWLTPDGKTIVGKLPDGVSINHFGVTVICFILYQYYHCQVTEPLLLEQLRDIKVEISSGQLSRVITEGKERFHTEKDEILRVGLQVSSYIHVDDTGARHGGKNGYATHIGNELFAWFSSTDSKSRINFLQLLRESHTDYVVTDEALAYMCEQKLPKGPLGHLTAAVGYRAACKEQWEALLDSLGISKPWHVRIATEGALLGSVLEHGLNPELVILSDDAGQFNVFLHALCWIHAERLINKLVGFNEDQRKDLEQIRSQIWELYGDLKDYKQAPTTDKKASIEARFDEIFTTKTCFASLNAALKRLHRNKAELLLVLDHPHIPLHNNLSERDIREYVKKRKISGSTRSEHGRRCRDTFASLKKTCRKLGVSFWSYLKDRISGSNTIDPLPNLIRQQAQVLHG